MGDTVAFWKSLQLGDLVSRPPDVTLDMVAVEEVRPPHGGSAKLVERPAATLYKATLPVTLKWQTSDPNETHRGFELRVQQFLIDLNAEQQYDPTVGTFSGPLVLVQDPDTDGTTVGSVTYGSSDTVTVESLIGAAIGDWFLLLKEDGDVSDPQFELFEATGVTGPDISCSLVSASWGSNDLIYKIWWGYRNAHIDGPFAIPSPDASAYRVRMDLVLNVKSADDPVFGS